MKSNYSAIWQPCSFFYAVSVCLQPSVRTCVFVIFVIVLLRDKEESKRYGRLSNALLRSKWLSKRARIVLKRGLVQLVSVCLQLLASLWLSPSFLSHPNRSTWIWPRWRHRLGSRWEKACVSLWGFFTIYFSEILFWLSVSLQKERKCVKLSIHQIESVWWLFVLCLYSLSSQSN